MGVCTTISKRQVFRRSCMLSLSCSQNLLFQNAVPLVAPAPPPPRQKQVLECLNSLLLGTSLQLNIAFQQAAWTCCLPIGQELAIQECTSGSKISFILDGDSCLCCRTVRLGYQLSSRQQWKSAKAWTISISARSSTETSRLQTY